MRNIMMVEAEIWTVARTDKGTAVLVRPIGSERAVPIFIGQLEANSILIGMGDVPMPRPLTHDLIVQMLEKLHAQVERVEINELQEGTYYARILLKVGMKKVVLDSRPSDALGLATRLKCQVFIAEYIVDEASIPLSMVSDGSDSTSAEEKDESGDKAGFDFGPSFPLGDSKGISDDILEQDFDLAAAAGFGPGASEHEPKNVSFESPLEIQRSVLKMQLDKAVAEENYEEAARIRDIISKLQE